MKNWVVKSFFVLVLVFVNYMAANAQAALLVLIFGDKVASEKFHMSIDAGLNVSSMPGLDKQSPLTGLYFGLGTYFKINDKWALTPEFKPISTRGATDVLPLNDYSSVLSNVSYDFVLNYIDVPVLIKYKIHPKFFVAAGPQISFLTSANQLANGKLPLGNSVDLDENIRVDFEPIYYSLPLELGYSVSSLRNGKGINLKFRYNIGLSEMISNTKNGSSKGSTMQVFLSFPFITTPETAQK